VKRLLFLLAACSGDRHAATPPIDAEPIAHVTKDAGVSSDAGPPRYIGVITASELVDVAPPFDGVLSNVLVRAGDHVTANQVVAEMDPAPLRDEAQAAEAALSAAGASLRQAEVNVEDAKHQLDIEKASVAAGTSPQSALDTAALGLKRAQAAQQQAASSVAAERARTQTAHDRLDKTELRAPFAGTVGERYRDPGSTIAGGTAVVRVVGQGDLLLRFAAPPDVAAPLVPGMKVTAEIDNVADPVPATIRHITPGIDSATGMVIIEAELATDPKLTSALRPGTGAKVTL
jgi:RND family efflux transporter MFP subunit